MHKDGLLRPAATDKSMEDTDFYDMASGWLGDRKHLTKMIHWEGGHRERRLGWGGNGFALEWFQNEVTLRYPRRAVNKQMNIPP